VRTCKNRSLRAGDGLALAARRSLGNEQGLALVITLFVVALVTVLVLEYHFDAAVELDLAANYAGDVQAYHLALAGVHFAQAMLQRDNAKSDGPENDWYKLGLVPACFAPQQLLDLAATGGGEGLAAGGSEAKGSALTDRLREDTSAGDVGCVSLRITDEDSKLPVNALMPPPGGGAAPDPTWVQIFQAFFASFKIDPEVVNALIDWIAPEGTPGLTGGSDRSYYERLPVPYKPPHSRMRTSEELRLVKGLDNPEELAKLFPGTPPEALADLDLSSNSYLTPFGAEQPPPPGGPPQPAKMNLNTAAPEVLTALIAGVQGVLSGSSAAATVAQEIIAQRQEKQFDDATKAVRDPNIMLKLNKVVSVKSIYFRIESVGVVGNVHKKIVAVLKRGTQRNVNTLNMLYFKVE
jgi:type II secretory pathway component PulK